MPANSTTATSDNEEFIELSLRYIFICLLSRDTEGKTTKLQGADLVDCYLTHASSEYGRSISADVLQAKTQEDLGSWVVSWIDDCAVEQKPDKLHKLAAAIGECEQGILNKHGERGLKKDGDTFIARLIETERLSLKEAPGFRVRREVARQKYFNYPIQRYLLRNVPSTSTATESLSRESAPTGGDDTASSAVSAA